MADDGRGAVERGVLTIPDSVWALARRRAEVIRELAVAAPAFRRTPAWVRQS
jgi:hypothetical protein